MPLFRRIIFIGWSFDRQEGPQISSRGNGPRSGARPLTADKCMQRGSRPPGLAIFPADAQPRAKTGVRGGRALEPSLWARPPRAHGCPSRRYHGCGVAVRCAARLPGGGPSRGGPLAELECGQHRPHGSDGCLMCLRLAVRGCRWGRRCAGQHEPRRRQLVRVARRRDSFRWGPHRGLLPLQLSLRGGRWGRPRGDQHQPRGRCLDVAYRKNF